MQPTLSKSFRYINRKNDAYFLHSKGKQKVYYHMTRCDKGALEAFPDGYEILEKPDGEVTLRLIKARLITHEEEEMVKAQLFARQLGNYRVEVKGINIVVHEPHGPDKESIPEMFWEATDELSKIVLAQLRKKMDEEAAEAALKIARLKWDEDLKGSREQLTRYSPILRFRLSNRTTRIFSVARIDSDHGLQEWWELDKLSLPAALNRYLRHLGKASFNELI